MVETNALPLSQATYNHQW